MLSRAVLRATRTSAISTTASPLRQYARPFAPPISALQTVNRLRIQPYSAKNRARAAGIPESSYPGAKKDRPAPPKQQQHQHASPKESEGARFSDAQPEVDSSAQPNRNRPSKTIEEHAEVGEPVQDAPRAQKPLPDLRQGIPSTFSAEFLKEAEAKASQQSQDDINITDDPNKQPPSGSGSGAGASGGGRGDGELPDSAYETSTDRRRNRLANWSTLIALIAGSGSLLYYGREWESEKEAALHAEDAPQGWTPGLVWKRMKARWSGKISYYTDPTFDKLLPDMDPAPPYTLVLSLSDLLVHSEWTREHGWRLAKRPGLDYFLRYLCQYYEIVVFTDLPSTAAEPLIRKLDPLRMIIMWPLFREATRYEKGEYIKDLSHLNRDLSKVILIDTKPHHAKLQPENAIILPPWDGKPGDKGLVNLIPFLEYLAGMGIPDVRSALKSFEGTDIPSEFARRESIARAKFNAQLAEEKSKKQKPNLGAWLGGALGIKATPMTTPDGMNLQEGFEQGKMLSDQMRERGQRQYEAMDKELKENSAKWLKELEDEEKRQMEAFYQDMKSGKSLKALFGGEGPPLPGQGEPGKERK